MKHSYKLFYIVVVSLLAPWTLKAQGNLTVSTLLDNTGAPIAFPYIVQPKGLAVDNDRNVYVSHFFGRKLLKIDGNGSRTFQNFEFNDYALEGLCSDRATGSINSCTPGNFPQVSISSATSGLVTFSPTGTSGNLIRPQIFRIPNENFREIDLNALFAPKGVAKGPDGIYVTDQSSIVKSGPNQSRINYAGIGGYFVYPSTGYVPDASNINPNPNFNTLNGIAVAPDRTIYLTEIGFHHIKRLSPTGQVTIFAGAEAGFADGNLSTARFNNPTGLLLDSDGNLYVADSENARIRKITPAGIVSTYVGTGVRGNTDGPIASAVLNEPIAMDMDNLGNLYILDKGSNSIKVVQSCTFPSAFISASGPLSLCPNNSTVRNQRVTLTANDGDFRYLWSNGATTKSIVVEQSGTFTVRLISMPGGCTSAVSQPVTVTLNPANPIPTITPSGSTQLCFGQSVTLTSSVPNGNLWSTGDTTRSITINATQPSGSYSVINRTGPCPVSSASVTVSTPTSFNTLVVQTPGPYQICPGDSILLLAGASVSGTLLWSTGQTGSAIFVKSAGSYTVRIATSNCTSAVSAPVVVNMIATPTITASGPTSFCTAGSVTLTASSSSGYLWSNGATTRSITVTASGSFTVRTIDNGCTSRVSTPTVVTVNPQPTTPTISAGGPTSFCSGNSVTLTSSATVGNLWSTGATTQSITVSASGTYTVRVQYANCTSSVSSPVVVNVSTTPAKPTISTPNGTVSCTPGPGVNLVGPSGFSYLWSDGTVNQTLNTSTSGTYTLRVISGNCTSAASDPVTVVVNTAPSRPTINIVGNTTLCPGSNMALSAPAGLSYLWSTGATTQNITITSAGIYTVQTISNGCTSAVSLPMTINLATQPSTPVISTSGSTTVCQGGSVVLTAPSSLSYLWSTGATTQSITATSSGPYTVRVANGACLSAASTAVTVTVNTVATPTISPAGPVNLSAVGGTVTLTASAADGYIWSNGATTPSITVTSDGVFSLRTISGSCTSSVSNVVTVNANATPSVATVAGTGGSFGFTNGTGAAARFTRPWGIAFESNGNLLIADQGNNRIRRMTPSFVVTTFVGSGSGSFADGTGTAASFNNPTALAIDAAGNVYVADQGNNRIRKITPAGVVTTIAGSTSGFADGTGTAARFNSPSGILVHSSGDIYVADAGNSRIRKVTQEGVVTTLAGSSSGFANGTGTAAQFNSPNGLAWDVNGDILVADRSNNRIRRVTLDGVVTTVAGLGTAGSVDGNSTAATFRNPTGLAVDATGNIFVADQNNNKIRRISTTGAVSTYAGTGTASGVDGLATVATFDFPAGLAFNSSGALFVGDAYSCAIRSIFICNTEQPVITAAGPTSFCTGGNVTLTSSVATGNLWSTGATSRSITVNASGNYSVRVVSGLCTSSASSPVAVTVNANPIPRISTSGSTWICDGNSVTLTSNITSNIIWSNGATTPSIIVSSLGDYFVSSLNGTCTSQVVTVVVNPLPATPTIEPAGAVNIISGQSVTLTGPAGGLLYVWSNGANTRSIQVTQAGSYRLTMIDANMCTSAVSEPTIVSVSSSVTTWNGSFWSNGLPSAQLDAFVTGPLAVTSALTAKSLTFSAPIVLNADWTVMGSVDGSTNPSHTISGAGNLVLQGNTQQLISGFLGNVRLNNAAGALTSDNTTIAVRLSLQSGTLSTSSNRLLLTGTVDDFSAGMGGTISGRHSFRLTSSATSKSLRHLTIPLNTQGNSASQILPSDQVMNNDWSVWNRAQGLSTSILNNYTGLGYSFLREAEGTVNFTFNGTINTGTIPVSFTRTNQPSVNIQYGWNALGNPYPSAIDWSLMKNIAGNSANSNLSAFIWRNGQYVSLNRDGVSTTAGISRFLAPGQGFLLRKSTVNTHNLVFNNSVRVNNPSALQREEALPEMVRLTLHSPVTPIADRWLAYATDGQPAQVSAEKILSPEPAAPSIYSVSADADIMQSIAGYPYWKSDEVRMIPLQISAKLAGEYTLDIETDQWPAGTQFHWLNPTTQTWESLTGNSVKVWLEADQLYTSQLRISSAQSLSAASKTQGLKVLQLQTGLQLIRQGAGDEPITVQLMDAAGRAVMPAFVMSQDAYFLPLNLPKAVYLLRSTVNGTPQTTRIGW